ncbi:hypothetical protein [Streptomyces hiroshimensis]|uniref:Uncharacterized protein n=1 Tax=Streptomyces hiroshimensis TaxID=66424 RepID=A0ABQ2Y8W6_9ACTN|nr:hypothetical protein [Streptomyces hiroshimensis]GGX74368.1 hypothetical protein GCM10010324_19630 [Streptomyces hiroshimensis]
MDYGKLDAPLAVRLAATADDDEARDFPVVIRLTAPPSAEQLATLKAAGVSRVPEGRRTMSADLSRRDLERLSAEPWVLALSLSVQRRPFGGEQSR